jgi:hypothetical protein
MRRLVAVAAVAGALASAGCIKDFDRASFVAGLRLLGVKAEATGVVGSPAEVAPGETMTLTATTANPGGTAPTVTWDACLLAPPPATGQSVNQDCVMLDAGAGLVAFGSGDTVTATMPAIDPTSLGLPDQTNGFYLQVRERLEADGKTLIGFYGVRIYLGPLAPNPRNQNPKLTGIFKVPSADAGAADEVPLDDATPLEVRPNDEIALRALVTPESSEPYVVYDGDPRTTPPRMVTEKIRISWYTTGGSFSNDVTGVEKPDTTLKLDKHLPTAGTTIDLWVVARDERGGSDALHRTLVFR